MPKLTDNKRSILDMVDSLKAIHGADVAKAAALSMDVIQISTDFGIFTVQQALRQGIDKTQASNLGRQVINRGRTSASYLLSHMLRDCSDVVRKQVTNIVLNAAERMVEDALKNFGLKKEK